MSNEKKSIKFVNIFIRIKISKKII
jgi:hypothetical protein